MRAIITAGALLYAGSALAHSLGPTAQSVNSLAPMMPVRLEARNASNVMTRYAVQAYDEDKAKPVEFSTMQKTFMLAPGDSVTLTVYLPSKYRRLLVCTVSLMPQYAKAVITTRTRICARVMFR